MGRTQVIDSISGTGDVYEGEVKLCGVRYHLTVYQEMIDVGTGEIPGLQPVRRSLSADPITIAEMSRKKLSLHLEDGRWLDFFFTDIHGTVIATDGFYTRET